MARDFNYKQFNREFRTEHKLFLLSVFNRGQSIKVLERSQAADFQVTFDLRAAGWLCDTLKEALVCSNNQGFFRKFRGSSYVLLVEIQSNRRGRFLRKLEEAGQSRKKVNWENPSSHGQLYGGGKNWKEASHQVNKNWKLLLVVYQDNIMLQWNTINAGLTRKSRRKVNMTELYVDRAILRCANVAA
ncbi:hypothetical protein PanWU01x14_037480 [Parasponia andersonii]|uniref:Uncharacterized protein n=1 Tax=Parasponia andersonii TaxID=3476 RepID=A0A2P5DRY3_PARAD|nr:hypothetical protein PanWU01x14_037480 [Parasponia andersonii]